MTQDNLEQDSTVAHRQGTLQLRVCSGRINDREQNDRTHDGIASTVACVHAFASAPTSGIF